MKYDSLLWKLPLGVLLGILAVGAYLMVKDAPAWMQSQIQREADKTRTATRQAITENMRPILGEAKAWRKDTNRQLDDLRNTVDAHATDLAVRADKQLTRTNDTIAGLRNDIQPSLTHVEAITQHADEASAILFRRDALPAQMLGLTAAAKVTLGETAQTMRTVRDIAAKEGPATAKAVRVGAEQLSGVATDFHTLTTDATKPIPWYRKMGSILYTGSKVVTALL